VFSVNLSDYEKTYFIDSACWYFNKIGILLERLRFHEINTVFKPIAVAVSLIIFEPAHSCTYGIIAARGPSAYNCIRLSFPRPAESGSQPSIQLSTPDIAGQLKLSAKRRMACSYVKPANTF
jgi:hypothetical protein